MAVAGCSDGDVTEFEGEAVPLEGADEPDLSDVSGSDGDSHAVDARLGLDGSDLVVSLRNRSNQEATVALSVDVDLLSGHFVNREVATVRVGATQTLRVVLPAERLQGFDVASQEWSRTTLREANGQLAAVFLANNTMERAVSIGATIGVNALRISPASSVAAFYCHTGTDTGCTTQRTLRVHLSTTHGKSSSTQAPVTSSRGRTTELRLLLSCVLSLSRRADFARFRYTHDGPH